MNSYSFRTQASICRRLANQTNCADTRHQLYALAKRYEQQATQLDSETVTAEASGDVDAPAAAETAADLPSTTH
ncbi:MAG TPA: hypothetical protein VGD08_00020 [Stellaceae bacterium]|jgi:hypothetical protein